MSRRRSRATSPPRDLKSLRAEVAKTDGELGRLLGRRLELAHEIGRTKLAAGLPLRDYDTERIVVENWKRQLSRIGIPPERAEIWSRWLIEESVRVQEDLSTRSARQLRASTIAIVGGAGAMGRWLTEFFEAMGHRVVVVDPRSPPASPTSGRKVLALGDALHTAEVVVIATPMRIAPRIFQELLSRRPTATVLDILSVKRPVLPWIRRARARGIHVTSVHPLFGPSARTLSGRNLLILDCGDARANQVARALFAQSSLTITQIPVEDHDALIADTLALPHLISLVFALTLAGGGHAPEGLFRAAPTSFLRQAEASQVIASENPELSFDIQQLNPSARSLFHRLERASRQLASALESQDPRVYGQELLRATRALKGRPGAHPPPDWAPGGQASDSPGRGRSRSRRES